MLRGVHGKGGVWYFGRLPEQRIVGDIPCAWD